MTYIYLLIGLAFAAAAMQRLTRNSSKNSSRPSSTTSQPKRIKRAPRPPKSAKPHRATGRQPRPTRHIVAAPPASPKTPTPDAYRTVRFLFTEQERYFYGALRHVLKPHPEWVIHPKVRVADFIKALRGADYDFLNGRHIDFLICTRDYHNPTLGIELDDPTHDRPRSISRDAALDAIYRTANFPILHIATAEQYDPDALAALVLDALHKAPHWGTRPHHHV